MDEDNEARRLETEEVDPDSFVYTSETKESDLPKQTLTHLRVDSSVQEIPAKAFEHCRALVQVQLPATLTRITQRAFWFCSNLECVRFVSDASLDASLSNDNLEDGLTVFPETMLHIDDSAFAHCYGLRKVIFSSASTRLSNSAFEKCTGLISVELPEKLKVIAEALFGFCGSLTTINIPSSVIKIGACAFSDCRSLPFLDLPHGLVKIGDRAFQYCDSIDMRIPPTVSVIGMLAFYKCSGLQQVKLPPMEVIEDSLFNGCKMLEYVEIPATVKKICVWAFYQCTSLSHIRIPPSVGYIARSVFSGCSNLISIELPDQPISTNAIPQYKYPEPGIFDCCQLVNLVAHPACWVGDRDKMERFLRHKVESFFREGESNLGSVVDGYDNFVHTLNHRFDNAPMSKLCYYQSYYSLEDAMTKLSSLMDDDPLAATTQVDAFGMTPLHVLCLSQTPNLSMLLAVISGGHQDHIIFGKDSFGFTPMDYLCWDKMPTSAEVIRRVLQMRFDELLGLDRPWKSNMLQTLDEALAVNGWRRRGVAAIYLKLANYEREETLSFLLELCLWKIKICDEAGTKEETPDREFCRVNSGAPIVIPRVLSFLGKRDAEDHYFSLRDRKTVRVLSQPG
eukprot:scaffold8114_cov126-Cylindrotheca_fusiformis.AAC.16